MKKALSIILLISMLMSMLLIPSAAVEEPEVQADPEFAYRTNVMRGPLVNATQSHHNGFGGRSGSGKPLDGYRGYHTLDNSAATAYELTVSSLTPQYDINDNKVAGGKYVASVTYKFSADYGDDPTIEIIRVYLDWINVGGTDYSPYMVNGFDIAISETAEDDSWEIVYSVTDFADGKKYQSNYTPENGRENAYVEIKLDKPTKANYIRYAVTDADNKTAKNNTQKKRTYLAELEVWTAKELDTTYRENVALTATVPGRPLGFTPAGYGMGLSLTDAATDGNKGFYPVGSTSGDSAALRYSVAASILGNLYFDIDAKVYAKNAQGAKYQGYITYQFTKASTIEVIRLYQGILLDDGNPYEYMSNGFDIAISDTGEAGSWKIVYSANKIADDELYQVYETEDGQKVPYIEAWFEPTKAKFIRIAIADPSSKFATTTDEKRYFHINEIEAWTVEEIPESFEETEVEEPAINSLMLFPLLMRHRQYETETSTTMFGLRVKHLLRSADAITFEKNGVKVDIPAATLKALNLAGSDKLVVTIVGEQVTVTVNGKAVDIEGIASSTPVEPEEEKGTTYRWDFDDLNEKNGTNNLTDSAASTKNYTFEDGMIKIADRTTDFKMAEAITLTPWTDWSIEWRSRVDYSSCLFGTEASNLNFLYLAYSVSSFNHSFRMVDSTNKKLQISYGEYANLNTEEMRTWKVEYSSADNRLVLKTYDDEAKDWVQIGAGTPPSFNFELTHMFGRYGEVGTNVCLQGEVDYIEVFVGE